MPVHNKADELELILSQTPFMLTRCSSDLRYLFVSPAYAEMLGRPTQEITGKSIIEIVGDQAFSTIYPHVQRVLSGEDVEYEADIPYANIGVRSLHVIYKPERDESGTVKGWVASLLDITDTKRAQNSLAESLRRERVVFQFVDRLHRAESDCAVYDAALDSILGGLLCDRASILLFDDNEVMKFVASRGLSDEYIRAVEGHSPWTAKDVNAQPISIDDIESADLEEHLKSVIQHEGIKALNFVPLVTPRRVIGKFMFYFNSPRVCEPEELDMALSFARQLAFAIDRRRTDRALRENEARLRLATQTGKVGIWDWNITTNTVLWTDSLYEIHGVSKDSFAGTLESFASLVHSEDQASLQSALDRSLKLNEPYELEFRIKKPNGEIGWVFTTAAAFHENGEPVRMIGATLDITDRKAAEAAREGLLIREHELRQVAEESNRLKDEFLAIMSHELRNPLNVILGYSELLVRSKEITESPQLFRMADAIKRNSLIQSKLIRDLLDLSRLRSGKLVLNREVVPVLLSINNAVDTVRAEAESKGIKIAVDAVDEGLFVNADPVRLEQIIWNLLNNAVKFTSAGGSIRVELDRQNGNATLAIADTGQGIDAAFLPHVFEIFRQADCGTRRIQSGMGVGLAVVRQLVELHQGQVSVASDGVGKGAQFTITMPLSTQSQSSIPVGVDLSEGALNNLRVLVLDDSEDTSEMLSFVLKNSGAKVVATTNGKEALRIANEMDFDAILTDISMPEMDGYDFLRRIKCNSRNASVPVLALTGFGRNEDIEKAGAEGFHSHLTKPLDIDLLMNLLKDLPTNRNGS